MKKNDGKNFEHQTKLFFSKVFEEIGYVVNKERTQFSGTQDGFDVLFVVSDEFIERKIFIECKDYSTNVSFGEIYTKAHEIECNYKLFENDIAFFISPRSHFSNSRNSEKSEPIFNSGKFPFEIRLLDLGNKIDRLFSIDTEIYKAIYKKFPAIEGDKEKVVSRFESILKSRGVLKKIILDERHRYEHIVNIIPINNFIQRTISGSKKDKEQYYHFHHRKKNQNTLQSVILKSFENNDVDGVVLLGNPGTGKSSELKQLAILLWETKEEVKHIPFFRTVNTFSSSDKIEEYLPKDWKHIQRLVIILDGLDEIPNPKDFISQLEKFTVDNKNGASKIKFVLSCRTNIYETNVNNITNFKPYFLDDISFSDAYKFLEDVYDLSYEMLSEFSSSHKQLEYLINPYYLNLFGRFYKENKTIPTNKAILIEAYVKSRFENDRKNKYKKKAYDDSQVEFACKRMAITMEARQINKIEEKHLNILLKSEKNLFINSPFVEKVLNENNWKFEHRNLQEFFVAKSLSKLSFEDIIDFIAIDDKINKVHPSWLNSVSFLLNLMEDDSKYNTLLKWLQENDSNILFHADSTRVGKGMQINVFQQYFSRRCKEQKLWIRKHDSSFSDLIRFADCRENVDFLFKEVKDNENHRRTRISAIDVIAKMNFSHKREELKNLFLDLLSSPLEDVDFDFKTDILHTILDAKLFFDNDYINQIIKALGDFDNHRLISVVLDLIEKDNPNKYLEYIKNVTPKILDDSKKNYPKKDNWFSNEDKNLKNVINQLDVLDTIEYRFKIILHNEYTLAFKEEDVVSSINMLIELHPENEKKIYKIAISSLNNDIEKSNDFFEFSDLMRSFFLATNTIEKAFIDIYGYDKEFSYKRRALTSLYTSQNFEIILNDFEKGIISKKELTFFRNNLSHVDFTLGKEFENQIRNATTYNFNNKFLSQEKRDEWTEFHQTTDQLNFDLLFKKHELENKIEEYFSSIEEEYVTYENNRENKTEYWNSLELRKKFPSSFMMIIYNALHANDGKVGVKEVKAVLNSEFYLINQVKNSLNDNKQIKVKDDQLDSIEEWCVGNISRAKFNNLNISEDNFTLCELLWFFRNKFDFTYPENVLLDMLLIDGKMKTNDSDYYGHDYIFKNVDQTKLKGRIVYNLNNKLVKDTTFKSHANFVLKHNLKESYNDIREYLSDDSQMRYYRSQVLPDYINKTNDVGLLKKLVKPKVSDQYSDDLTWESVAILIALGENNFAIEKLLEFFEVDDNHKSQLRTIVYLIRANYDQAFKIFNKWLKEGIDYYKEEVNYRISSSDWKEHKNPASIPYLIELIKIGVNTKYDFGRSTNPMRIATDVLINIAEKNDIEICLKIIKDIKVCVEDLADIKYETFYVNTLLNDLHNVYYKLKSKPLPFPEIEQKLETFKYEI